MQSNSKLEWASIPYLFRKFPWSVVKQQNSQQIPNHYSNMFWKIFFHNSKNIAIAQLVNLCFCIAEKFYDI